MKRSSLKRDFVSYVDRLHFWKECGKIKARKLEGQERMISLFQWFGR